MTQPFWRTDPSAPFATLISVANRHCHPEAWEDGYEALQRLALREGDAEMNLFKQELRQAILEPDEVPVAELSAAVQYDDGSPEAFLRRLWRDLYGDELVTPPT